MMNKSKDIGKSKAVEKAKQKNTGLTIQRMPWHVKEEFPRNRLETPNSDPNTPITGYRFIGYSYSPKNDIVTDSFKNAVVSAAGFIAELNPPKQNELMTDKQIGTYCNMQYENPKNPKITFEEEKELFSGIKRSAELKYAQSYPASDNVNSIIEVRNVVEGINGSNLSLEQKKAEVNSALDRLTISSRGMAAKRRLVNNGDFNKIIESLGKEAVDLYKKEISTISTGGTLNGFDQIDPFQIQVKTKYSSSPPQNELVLHYQFSRESYGYIVRVEKDGKTFRMANTLDADIDNIYYGNSHAACSGTVLESADKQIESPPQREAPHIIDAITKLGGEGARWQCVREHADTIKDSTIICTRKDDESGYVCITFENLWKNWKSLFKYEFNIDDSQVKEVLKKGGSPDITEQTDRPINDYIELA